MSFFEHILPGLNEESDEPAVLICDPDPERPGWTLCNMWIPDATRRNQRAGRNAEVFDCFGCWEVKRRIPRSKEQAAHELNGFLAQVSTLEFPHPGAAATITLRTIFPGRWLVTFDVGDYAMIFSPDGTEWEIEGDVPLHSVEACKAASLPLPEAVELAERLLADGTPIYPIGDRLRTKRA